MGEPVMVVVVPAAAALVAGGAAYVMARRGWRIALWAVILLNVIAFFLLTFAGQRAEGWDGMGYALMALFLALPGFVGASLGGWIGSLRARRAARPPATD